MADDLRENELAPNSDLETSEFSNEKALELVRELLKETMATFRNESAMYTSFEKHAGVHRKTLKSFLAAKRSPYPDTIYAFLRWIYRKSPADKMAEALPQLVREYLHRNCYDFSCERIDLNALLAKSDAHVEIYLMTEDQQKITTEFITNKYGQLGLNALNDMLEAKVIEPFVNDIYIMGPKRALTNSDFYRIISKSITSIFPWDENNLNNILPYAGCTAGNIIINKDEQNKLKKITNDFFKKIQQLHASGLKSGSGERYLFTLNIFSNSPKPSLSEEEGRS